MKHSYMRTKNQGSYVNTKKTHIKKIA